MKQEEVRGPGEAWINVLASITNDVATLARRIADQAWELDRVLMEDSSGRTSEQAHRLNLMRDAVRRAGEELTIAVTISDNLIADARVALTRQEGNGG